MVGIFYEDLQKIRWFISTIQSPYGYNYCDCFEISVKGNFIVKISYPRFYGGINAYLITTANECEKVQENFYLSIISHDLLCDAEISLNRVDIPFTFIMEEKHVFNSYKKVYQVFNYIYKKKNQKANPKAYTDIENFKIETLTYADTPNNASYNSKIMIYDQYSNIKAKTGDEQNLYRIEAEYEGLSKRMRIEVSKRVQRKPFTILEFKRFDIFKEYAIKYRNYLLDNILDLNEVDKFYTEKAIELAKSLLVYKEESNNFNYENFIYKEIDSIYDYEIIRRALKICIENLKTREKAVTAIRKVLFKYQLNENIIIMETYEAIKSIKRAIESYF